MIKRALLAALIVLAGLNAHAQNAPLSGLQPRGTVQPTDIIPILPAGGAQLEQTTVAQLAIAGSGIGTVTSVGLAMPAPFNCTGSPVTGSGIISCTVGAQSANTIYAGPTSGGAATPTFRGLVAADFPASGVTAGSYTDTNFTVDATGRITAASSGVVGAAGGTLYVNASTGSDSNNCTASGTACLTIGHALGLVPKVLTALYTINVADGTYAECIDIGNYQGPVGSTSTPYLAIVGNVATQANVILTGSCTWPGTAGNVTYSIHDFTRVAVAIEGVTTTPSSTATFAAFADYGAVLLLQNVTLGNATNGVGVFHSALVNVFGTVDINGWTGFGVFTGVGGVFSNYDIGSTTLKLTPNVLGIACLHAEVSSSIDIDPDTNNIASGTVACPGGSNNVTSFADADNASATFVKFPVTAVNASTPSGSQIIYARHGSNVFINAAVTATNWTNSCTAYEAGSGDQGAGGRTFTSVGATNPINTGICVLF